MVDVVETEQMHSIATLRCASGSASARAKPERLERPAIRWHGRLELDAGTLTIRESLAALAILTARITAEWSVARRRERLRRWLVSGSAAVFSRAAGEH